MFVKSIYCDFPPTMGVDFLAPVAHTRDMSEYEYDYPTPTWSKTCECGATVERFRGQGDVTCDGPQAHSYNAGGQRLRDDWRGNRSWQDEDTDDMEGFERQMLSDENGW